MCADEHVGSVFPKWEHTTHEHVTDSGNHIKCLKIRSSEALHEVRVVVVFKDMALQAARVAYLRSRDYSDSVVSHPIHPLTYETAEITAHLQEVVQHPAFTVTVPPPPPPSLLRPKWSLDC